MFGRDSTGFIKPLFEQRDSEKLFRNNKAVFEELTVQKKDGKRTFFFYQNRQYLFHLQNQFSPIFFQIVFTRSDRWLFFCQILVRLEMASEKSHFLLQLLVESGLNL